jgi:hypothetical protein
VIGSGILYDKTSCAAHHLDDHHAVVRLGGRRYGFDTAVQIATEAIDRPELAGGPHCC